MLIGAKAKDKAYKATFYHIHIISSANYTCIFNSIFPCAHDWMMKYEKISDILKIKIFGFRDGNLQAFGHFLDNYNTLNCFTVTTLMIHIPGTALN